METRNENKTLGSITITLRDKVRAAIVFLITFAVLLGATVIKFAVVRQIRVSSPAITYIGLALCFAFLLTALYIYLINSRKALVASTKELAALCSAICFAYIFCFYISLADVFLMPVALTAFLLAPLSRRRDAFLFNLFCNVMLLVGLLIEKDLRGSANYYPVIVTFVIGMISGTLAAYNVSNDAKRVSYIVKGFLIGIFSVALMVVLISINAESPTAFIGHLAQTGIAAAVQIVLGLLLQPILESIFNLITNSRLVELTDHNSPLIKRLISEAPGTFNHCLAVANFSEVCATAIGENPYLARACAYYHDIGKLVNPLYFKENQSDYNPHDEVLPEVSAEIIRGHTTEGLKLCNEYRIPDEISHVTIQHHGTLPIAVFYNKAKQLTDGEVDLNEYSYHGVTPVTKVAAIIMICDSGEAAIRAMDKPDGERVDRLLKSLIDARIAAGQFDNCDVTLRDLDVIRKTIVGAYGGLFHKRMKYPDGRSA